jgi:SPP1 gp7 family putative phage head morphogenesis protein
MPKDALTSEQIDAIIVGVYIGNIDIYNLPIELYSVIHNNLAEAIIEGFGDVATAEEQVLIESLYHNVQAFSGAKTANEILDFESMIYKDGKIVEFAQFRSEVLKKYNLYNKTYLAVEYGYTVEQAKAAKRWVGIWNDKKLFPLLQYVTVGDDRVRPTHRALDGTVRPVGDSFWSAYYPPWSYRCRCTTKSYESGEIPITEIMNVKKQVTLPPIDRQFKFNSGKKKIIFSPYHPYFTDIPKEYKEWARVNFGLPMVKDVMRKNG